MMDLEPLLYMKTERMDIVRAFQDSLMRTWEERYGYSYLKKKEAEHEFEFFRNEHSSLD
jgi:hypothetical protein